MQTSIIGVRFTTVGKVYHFDATSLGDVTAGEHVIVDTARGRHLGEVVQVLPEAPVPARRRLETRRPPCHSPRSAAAAVLAGSTDRSHDQLPGPCR